MKRTKKNNIFLVLAAVVAAMAAPASGWAGSDIPATSLRPPIVLAATYSASGTHQCRASDGSIHSCVVTGVIFGNCVEAASSLRTQDCCPSSRECSRDSQGREQCRRGGVSTEFTMSYCIPGIGQ